MISMNNLKLPVYLLQCLLHFVGYATQIPLMRFAGCCGQHTPGVRTRRLRMIGIAFAVKISQDAADRVENGFGRACVPSFASATGEHICMCLSLQQENHLGNIDASVSATWMNRYTKSVIKCLLNLKLSL